MDIPAIASTKHEPPLSVGPGNLLRPRPLEHTDVDDATVVEHVMMMRLEATDEAPPREIRLIPWKGGTRAWR